MSRLILHWFLLRVVGRQIALGYGAVSLLSVAILASLYMASQYGLEAYVSDQLERIPWEVSVLQRGESHRFRELQAKYLARPGVREVQGLGFLRLRNLSPVKLEIGNEAVSVRWIAFVSASSQLLLPPELRKPPRRADAGSPSWLLDAALVGSPAQAAADSLRDIRSGSPVRFTLVPDMGGATAGHTHDEQAMPHSSLVFFEGELAANPVQLDRQEFNRWMLREVGALAYLPEEAIVFPISPEQFRELAFEFHNQFFSSEGMHGGDEPPTYVPEMTHLLALDRRTLVSTWDLGGSLQRLEPEVRAMYQEAQDLTPFSWVNSDLVLLLSRMYSISRLISLATLLVGIPLLWMGWVLARWLGRLLVLNQRRLIGLALLRGISSRDAERAVLFALVLGGTLGGLLGLLLGTGLPILAYTLAGHPPPAQRVLLEALVYYGAFLLVGVAMAVLSGRDVLLFVRRLTPREAIARAEGEEAAEKAAPALSWYYVGSFTAALLLGTYKIGSWIAGRSLLLDASRGTLPDWAVRAVVAFEGVLNFAAVPLLLYGLAGLLLWRVAVVQKAISTLTTPLVGNLDWFVSQYMALRRQRVAQLLFVAGMATSLSLMPQIAGDGFYDRILRGVRTSLGTDVILEFDVQALGNNSVVPAPLGRYQQVLQPQVRQMREAISKQDGVASVEVIQQFLIPGIYIPGQSGLVLNLMDSPGNYLKMVHHEEGLGLTRPFSEAITSLNNGNVLGSQGLFRLRAIPLQKPVIISYDSQDQPILVHFGDVVAFLPGQPARGVEQREGFAAAEVDYVNYLLGADARMVFSRQHLAESPQLEEMAVVPSRTVFLISAQNGVAKEDLIARLRGGFSKATEVRWEAGERARVGKDMFVSLALENMRVYMVGSLLLACASVAAIALANFAADRRTFGLLRLRGLAPALLLRISLSFFLIPVLAGVLVGVGVGALSGYGLSQAIWDLPRIYGVGSFLANRLILSPTAGALIVILTAIFVAVAFAIGLWLFRRTAREAIRE